MLNDIEIENSEFVFGRLVGFRDGFYTDIPSFNLAVVQDENIRYGNKKIHLDLRNNCNVNFLCFVKPG